MLGREGARLVSTSGLVMLARLGGAGLGFGTQILLARTLAAEDLGLFFLATSIAAVIGTMAALGYPHSVAQLFARYRERSRPERLAALARHMRREVGGAALLLTVLVCLAALWSGPAGPGHAIAAASLVIPATALMRVNGALANAARRFSLAFFPDLFFRPLVFLLAVLVMIGAGLQVSATTLGLAMSLVTVGAAAAQWWWLRPSIPRSMLPCPRRLARRWRATAGPLIIVGLFSTLFADLGVIMSGLFLDAPDLAAFGICVKLAFLVGFAVQIAHQVAAPELAASHARRESVAAPRILGHANVLAVAVTFAALVVCAAAGDRILAVFGPGYADAKAALVVIVASQFVRACFGPNVQLLTITGLQRPMAAVFALSVAVLAAANVVLVPGFGILGAAAAVAFTTLFWALALAVVLYRGAGIRADVLIAR